MSLSEVVHNTWVDYKENFKPLVILMLLFVGLPTFIVELIKYFTPEDFVFIPDIIGSLIISLLGILVLISVVRSLSIKKPISINQGLPFYGYAIILGILMSLAVFGLSLLLLIPGIIFAVYWSLSFYVLVAEKLSITDAMKRSKELITDNWWRTLGYFLAFGMSLGVIVLIVSMILGIPGGLLALISPIGSAVYLAILSAVIVSFVQPLSILFGYNYYKMLKK